MARPTLIVFIEDNLRGNQVGSKKFGSGSTILSFGLEEMTGGFEGQRVLW